MKLPLPKKLSRMSVQGRQKESIKWYKKRLEDMGKNFNGRVTPNTIGIGRSNYSPIAGQIVFFKYDAKHKATLPYWDAFPLAMVIDIKSDRWLAINLHYLPYAVRFSLVDRLLGTINNNNFDESTTSKINYGLVKGLSSFKIAQPALKTHLFGHIVSKISYIPPNEWGYIASLPLENFVGASSSKVWSDSLSKM